MTEQPKDRPDGDEVLKAARSRIAAMKIAPCSGLTSSRAAAVEIERALDFLSAAPTRDGAEGVGTAFVWKCRYCKWSGTEPDSAAQNNHGHSYTAPLCPKCGRYFSEQDFPAAPLKPAPDAMREVARNLVQNASSIIHTDAVGHRFQKVFECDLKALAAALSAPVPPADGAGEKPLLEPQHSSERK